MVGVLTRVLNLSTTIDRLSEWETGVANEQRNQPEDEQDINMEGQSVDAETSTDMDMTENAISEDLTQEQAVAQIEALTRDLAQAKDQVMRSQAEVQNIRRRAQLDVEKAHKFGLEKFVNDLLPVVDNLERAVASIDTSNDVFKAVTDGIELTLKSFSDTLTRHNVEPIDPEGAPFDPQLHQAMSIQENADVEPNTVMTVFQKGYSLHGRLVRPAMVVVSKAPASKQDG